MTNLKVTNEKGSTYSFTVFDHRILLTAVGNSGKVFNFALPFGAKIEGGKLKTTCGRLLPISNGAQEISAFLESAATRKLVECDTHEEVMDLVRDEKIKTGQSWLSSNGKHCVYVYNK